MSSKMSLIVTHVMKGPTLRINLTALSNGESDCEATTETFVIDNLLRVCVKVYSTERRNINVHKFSMTASKHELPKNDAISMNVTCIRNTGRFEKWPCSHFTNTWNVIGQIYGSPLNLGKESVYSSHIEIIITVYTITKHPFSMLYGDCDFTDFTLSTADGKVAVHKACLAAHSPVFKTMFTGTWKEAEENIVEIKDYSLQTIQHLKDFLYLGTLPNNGLRPLIRLAALYSMNDLTKACARKLAETVQPGELYSLHEFACANNIPELSCAISQLTLDEVVDQDYQMKKKNDENENKLNNEKQTEDNDVECY